MYRWIHIELINRNDNAGTDESKATNQSETRAVIEDDLIGGMTTDSG